MTAALIGLTSVVNANVIQIGQFTGDYQEGFEGIPSPGFPAFIDVFDLNAEVRTTAGGSGVNVTGNWNDISPKSGIHLMGVAAGGGANWIFDTPAMRFGGYFTHIFDSDATAMFYDQYDNIVGIQDMTLTRGVWL